MQLFMARQPIFDRSRNVFAYELLFRNSADNSYSHDDGNLATVKLVCNTLLTFGLDNITNGKRAFINFTQDLLQSGIPEMLPPDSVVIEILEDVLPTQEVVYACAKLKSQGYLLALDDFVFSPTYEPLVKLADLIKVDYMNTTPEARCNLPRLMGNKGLKFLAEKVETEEDFREALEAGYTYFQGYFFSKPVIVSQRDISTSLASYLDILNSVRVDLIDYDKLEGKLKKDLALSLKLLQFVNSAHFGLRNKVSSLRQALTLLGKKELERWLALVMLQGVNEKKQEELVTIATIRARFAEQLAIATGMKTRAAEVFLMELLAVLDALTGAPLEELLTRFPVNQDIKAALLGEQNRFGELHRLVLSYEQAQWDCVEQLADQFNISRDHMSTLYISSLEWAKQVSK